MFKTKHYSKYKNATGTMWDMTDKTVKLFNDSFSKDGSEVEIEEGDISIDTKFFKRAVEAWTPGVSIQNNNMVNLTEYSDSLSTDVDRAFIIHNVIAQIIYATNKGSRN